MQWEPPDNLLQHMILAYIISNSAEEAETIAIDLLERHLVYSVNIIPEITLYAARGR
jgi:uncharacterized protein involved in tolerance to divalent cations